MYIAHLRLDCTSSMRSLSSAQSPFDSFFDVVCLDFFCLPSTSRSCGVQPTSHASLLLYRPMSFCERNPPPGDARSGGDLANCWLSLLLHLSAEGESYEVAYNGRRGPLATEAVWDRRGTSALSFGAASSALRRRPAEHPADLVHPRRPSSVGHIVLSAAQSPADLHLQATTRAIKRSPCKLTSPIAETASTCQRSSSK